MLQTPICWERSEEEGEVGRRSAVDKDGRLTGRTLAGEPQSPAAAPDQEAGDAEAGRQPFGCRASRSAAIFRPESSRIVRLVLDVGPAVSPCRSAPGPPRANIVTARTRRRAGVRSSWSSCRGWLRTVNAADPGASRRSARRTGSDQAGEQGSAFTSLIKWRLDESVGGSLLQALLPACACCPLLAAKPQVFLPGLILTASCPRG